jgi:hypothetical protein
VPASKTALEICPKPIAAFFEKYQSRTINREREPKIQSKSLVLEDFSYKSFKTKDLAGISA